MPTLVEHHHQRRQEADQRVTGLTAELAAARDRSTDAGDGLAAAGRTHGTAVAAAAAAGTGLGANGTWPDADTRLEALRRALIEERDGAELVRRATYELAEAEGQVSQLEQAVADARAALGAADAELAEATTEAEQTDRWRAAAASTPLDDPVALTDAVRTGVPYADARAWLAAQVPNILVGAALARGKAAAAVTDRAVAVVEAHRDAADRIAGSPAPEWRAFRRRRAALAAYVRTTQSRLTNATSLLEAIASGPDVTAEQHAAINDPGALAGRTSALGLVTAAAEAADALADFELAVDQARANILADPTVPADTTDTELEARAEQEAEQTAANTRADLETALADARAAVTDSVTGQVVDWETAIPEPVWTRLRWFQEAVSLLDAVATTSTQLVADLDTAEADLVAVLDAAEPPDDRLAASAARAARTLAATESTQELRRVGMTRGEPNDRA
ncbi:MAG: hypothetical protein ACK5PP_19820 [Acidimicrobiales bacterium]